MRTIIEKIPAGEAIEIATGWGCGYVRMVSASVPITFTDPDSNLSFPLEQGDDAQLMPIKRLRMEHSSGTPQTITLLIGGPGERAGSAKVGGSMSMQPGAEIIARRGAVGATEKSFLAGFWCGSTASTQPENLSILNPTGSGKLIVVTGIEAAGQGLVGIAWDSEANFTAYTGAAVSTAAFSKRQNGAGAALIKSAWVNGNLIAPLIAGGVMCGYGAAAVNGNQPAQLVHGRPITITEGKCLSLVNGQAGKIMQAIIEWEEQ